MKIVMFQASENKSPVALFGRMEELLRPYPELVEEFLGFLKPEQALEVNRFIPYLQLRKMQEFFRKLNVSVRHILITLGYWEWCLVR